MSTSSIHYTKYKVRNTKPNSPARHDRDQILVHLYLLASYTSIFVRSVAMLWRVVEVRRCFPPPAHDLVVTTRLHRKYYKNGQLQISLSISSVFLHFSLHCARAASTEFKFTPACRHSPSDLVSFLLK